MADINFILNDSIVNYSFGIIPIDDFDAFGNEVHWTTMQKSCVDDDVKVGDAIKIWYAKWHLSSCTGLHEYDVSNLVQASVYRKISTGLKAAMSQWTNVYL